MSVEISDGVKEAWRVANCDREQWLSVPRTITRDLVIMADFARDQLAARLEAEHHIEVWELQDNKDHGLGNEIDEHVTGCNFCGSNPDWQREAERLLSGKEKS